MPDIYKDDIGTVFEITIIDDDTILDISTATIKQFKFKKPSGAVLTKTAAFSSDGTDGLLRYTSVAGDLDEINTYSIQAKITMPEGVWSSEITQFTVKDIL